jgi:hypothetical protein
MRLRGAQGTMAALAMAALVAGCSGGGMGGLFGAKSKSDAADSDIPQEISKPIGPHMVSRCPVPVAYDDATEKKIQAALEALPPDNILHKAMTDYETERDNLRMCQ